MNIEFLAAVDVHRQIVKATNGNQRVREHIAERLADEFATHTIPAKEVAAIVMRAIENACMTEEAKMECRGYRMDIIKAFTNSFFARLEAFQYFEAAYVGKK